MNEDEIKLVRVFAAKSRGVFEVAKSLLDDADIKYTTRNDFYYRFWATGDKEILVNPADEEEAKAVLKSLIEDASGEKIIDPRKDEFNFAATIGVIIIVIVVIFLAVYFVRC
jgi:hypothetical protein